MLRTPNLTPLVTTGRSSASLGRECLRDLVEVVTGHCLLNKHLSMWRVLPTKSCRLCEEEDETYHHLIYKCPATELARREILKSSYDSTLDYFSDLIRFSKVKRVRSLRKEVLY